MRRGAVAIVASLAALTPAPRASAQTATSPTQASQGEAHPRRPSPPASEPAGSADAQRVREALAALGLERAEASAQAGVLRLRGIVSSPAERRAAEQVAERAGPWLFVQNDLEVQPPEAGDALAEATDPDREVEGWLREIFQEVDDLQHIEVEARAGIVHLRGWVPDQEAAERAAELARDREGVVYVDDDITVDRSVERRLDSTWSRLEERGREVLVRLPLYVVALIIVGAGLFAASRLRRTDGRRRKNPLLRSMGRQIAAALIFVGAVLFALDLIEATAIFGAVLGTAGVLGLALGFAFRDIIENYLASVLLAVRRPFAPDDLVQIGEHEGKVVRLTSRDTVLMTLDGNHVRMPNAEVFKSVTTNFTLNPMRRVWFDVGIGVNEDLTVTQRVVRQAMAEMDSIATDPPPFTRIEQLTDWAVQLRAYGWVDQRQFDWYKVKSEALRRVKVALDEAGVEMPFPTYVLDRGSTKHPKGSNGEAGHEVEADHVIDEQVEADRAASGEKDLLNPT